MQVDQYEPPDEEIQPIGRNLRNLNWGLAFAPDKGPK